MNFSAEEIKQYQRHLSLPGFGPEAQGKLKEASVLVVGAGGLGCPALQLSLIHISEPTRPY